MCPFFFHHKQCETSNDIIKFPEIFDDMELSSHISSLVQMVEIIFVSVVSKIQQCVLRSVENITSRYLYPSANQMEKSRTLSRPSPRLILGAQHIATL